MITESSISEINLGQKTCEVVIDDLEQDEPVITLVVPVAPLQEGLIFRFVKRSADVLIASISLIILMPVFVIFGVLVYLEDRGPIIYQQVRIGRFGVPFNFFKIRSMRLDADKTRAELLNQSDAKGAAFKMKQDPRVTRVGRIIRKFSIDELPQLFSVLAGHMSIIGPRPHLPAEVKTYRPDQRMRLMAKPGLICLREISGRSHLTFEEWLKLDVQYVKERSLLLDLKIFVRAIPAVLTGHGAY